MNVDRFGSFATEIDCPRYVRFSSDSDHIAGAATGRKSATTGLMHRSKQPLRSITSSAAPSSEGGWAQPQQLLSAEIAVPLGRIRSDVRVALDTAP
jgi:hypothetical protein